MILIVDGDTQSGASLERALNYRGMSAIFVENGMEALSLLDLRSPELIVTDLKIGGIDGMLFIQAVRKDPKFASVPIVVLTSDFSERARRAAFEHGAQDCIIKGTIGRDSLISRLQNLISPNE